MTRNRSVTVLAGAAVIPLTALAVGCGGGGSSATASAPPTSTPPQNASAHTARTATVRVANTRLGKVLVNSQGHTLYLFKKDSGKKSACFGQCATFWPPLRTSGKPTVGSGAHASLIGTTRRSDGKPQVTYNGHPLYTFVMDKKAGQTNGEGVTAFGGKWFAVSPSGRQIPVKKSSTSSPSAPSGSPSNRPAAPASPQPAAPAPAPQPAAPKPAAPKPASPSGGGIPQNGGGDGDSDNNGGPSDGDGNL